MALARSASALVTAAWYCAFSMEKSRSPTLDDGTVGNRFLFQKSTDPGDQIHLIDRRNLPDEPSALADILTADLGHRHGRRRRNRRRGLVGPVGTTGQKKTDVRDASTKEREIVASRKKRHS
ncbi:hypothetical protein QW131_10225 [Roseibium salinum]|nr:hypothetical protein [Roseibium salinum]